MHLPPTPLFTKGQFLPTGPRRLQCSQFCQVSFTRLSGSLAVFTQQLRLPEPRGANPALPKAPISPSGGHHKATTTLPFSSCQGESYSGRTCPCGHFFSSGETAPPQESPPANIHAPAPPSWTSAPVLSACHSSHKPHTRWEPLSGHRW